MPNLGPTLQSICIKKSNIAAITYRFGSDCSAKVEFDYSIDKIIEKKKSIEQQFPSNPYKQGGNRKTKNWLLSCEKSQSNVSIEKIAIYAFCGVLPT